MAGFNTQVKRLGATFHVQTQDAGMGARYVESLIYKSGKVVSSRKTDYTPHLASPQLGAWVQKIMENQHQAILKEIESGRFDHYLAPEERHPGPDKG